MRPGRTGDDQPARSREASDQPVGNNRRPPDVAETIRIVAVEKKTHSKSLPFGNACEDGSPSFALKKVMLAHDPAGEYPEFPQGSLR